MSAVSKTLLYACAAICLAGVWPANQIAADYITDGNSASSVTIDNHINSGGGNSTSQTSITTNVNGQVSSFSTTTSGSAALDVHYSVSASFASGTTTTVITKTPVLTPASKPTSWAVMSVPSIKSAPAGLATKPSAIPPAVFSSGQVRITHSRRPASDIFSLFFSNNFNLKGFWWF